MKSTISNIHIYHRFTEHSSRLINETTSLTRNNIVDNSTIVVFWENGFKEHEILDDKREIYRIKLLSEHLPKNDITKAIMILELLFRIIVKFGRKKFSVVSCHSVEMLPASIFIKLTSRAKLIYDVYELETEKRTPLLNKFNRVIERLFIHYADHVITVSNSIAEWYKRKYSIGNVSIIKNVPKFHFNEKYESNILKKKLNIKEDEILFIFLGAFDRARFIPHLLRIFSKVDEKKHIVFLGYPVVKHFGDLIREYSEKYPNIHIHDAVRYEDVLSVVQSADVGISVIENFSLSYYSTIACKFFEYLLSGVPVVASNFPDMSNIIDEYQCGWKVIPEEKAVLNLINSLTLDDIKEKRGNVLRCRTGFGWHIEENTLLDVYKKVLSCS